MKKQETQELSTSELSTLAVIPAALQPIPEGGLSIPALPYDIRTNMQGAQPSIRLGAGITDTNLIPAPLLIHVCGFRTVRQIRLSEQYESPCDVSQILGLAWVKGRKVFACVTLSSSSSAAAERAMQYLELEGGKLQNIVAIGVKKETAKKGGFKFGVAEFSFKPATKEDVADLIYLFNQDIKPNADKEFLPLRNMVVNEATGELEAVIIP